MLKCRSCGFNINNNSALFCPGCGAKTENAQPERSPHSLKNVWPEWELEKEIGRGSFGVVYRAVRNDNFVGDRRAAIKIISIPADKSEIDSLRSEGLDYERSRTYFKDIVDSFVKEIEVMESLKGMQNIVSVEDYKVVEKTDEIGWDIYIRMELLTPLNEYADKKELTENDVLTLGRDICTALEYCNKIGIIHRDIKPENIFVNDFGDYKLGDFGIARKLESQTGFFSQKGTPNYMAPEVFYGRPYDSRADIYSLGIVLYRFLNNKFFPFIDSKAQLISPGGKSKALERRYSGEPLPVPAQASKNMASLILCACRYDPEKRFSSPSVMKKALESIKKDEYEEYSQQVEVLRSNNEETVTSEKIRNADKNTAYDNVNRQYNGQAESYTYSGEFGYNAGQNENTSAGKEPGGISLRLIAVIGIAALLVIACVSGGIFAGYYIKKQNETTDAVSATEEPATQSSHNVNEPQNNTYVPQNNNDVPVNVIAPSYYSEPTGQVYETVYVYPPDRQNGTAADAETMPPAATSEPPAVTAKPPYTTSVSSSTAATVPEKRMPSTKAEIIDFFRSAVNGVSAGASAGYTTRKWQAVNSVNLGGSMVNSVAMPVIEHFITSESDAAEESYSRGSNQARSMFPSWNLSDDSFVKSASCSKNGENYRITIVMKDEDTPKRNSSTLAKVSDSVYYFEDIDGILSGNAVVTKVLRSYGDVHVIYKNYTITADITPDGEFISLVHSSDIDVNIGYAELIMDLSVSNASVKLWTTKEYYNFNY